MPKNKGAGGKNRRKRKVSVDAKPQELVYKQDGEEYAQVIKSLGNGFMEVLCFTKNGNITKRGHIRGNMRRRSWMSIGDIVLVNIRDYQDSTCDILFKYTSEEAKILCRKGEIPDTVDPNNNIEFMVEDNITFDINKANENNYNVPPQIKKYEISSNETSEDDEDNNDSVLKIEDL